VFKLVVQSKVYTQSKELLLASFSPPQKVCWRMGLPSS